MIQSPCSGVTILQKSAKTMPEGVRRWHGRHIEVFIHAREGKLLASPRVMMLSFI